MPWLTDAVRDDRRLRIAEAALNCFARNGVDGTSMANIIAESGLSAGSIYSHFAGKAELVKFATTIAFQERMREMEDEGARGVVIDPPGALHLLLERDDGTAFQTLFLQLGAEATHNPELASIIRDNFETLRATLSRWLLPWATSLESGDDAQKIAEANADLLVTILGGYNMRVAIDPHLDAVKLASDLESSIRRSIASS